MKGRDEEERSVNDGGKGGGEGPSAYYRLAVGSNRSLTDKKEHFAVVESRYGVCWRVVARSRYTVGMQSGCSLEHIQPSNGA